MTAGTVAGMLQMERWDQAHSCSSTALSFGGGAADAVGGGLVPSARAELLGLRPDWAGMHMVSPCQHARPAMVSAGTNVRCLWR